MSTVKALVIGGGGGGGRDVGGGGGAGGYQYDAALAVTAQAYSVTVGTGGAGSDGAAAGTDGGDSIFSTITSDGGGGGATSTAGSDGGSGGGGTRTSLAGGSGTVGQGNDGGAGSPSAGANISAAGGGGGASAVGATATAGGGGNGGAGTANSISGSSVTYAGGGGGNGNGSATQGTGGAGGGGNGGSATGTAGTDGLGGGGGGSGSGNGGDGGDGVVIIRYVKSEFGVCTGGTITEDGLDMVHTFTSSGTFTVVDAPVFPTDWNRKAKLTIQSSKIDSTLTDYPVQITKNSVPSDMLDADGDNPAQADGGDIRVTSDAAGTTLIPCEVSYISTDNDPSNGSCNIFAKVPTVSSSADTEIYIWFNSASTIAQPAPSDTYGSENVWDSNFQTVIHFDEAVNNDTDGYPDSTSNAIHATGVSMALAAADADGGGLAADFDGGADYMTIGAPTISSAFTASFQVNHDVLGTQKYINDINGGKYFEVGGVTSGKCEALWNWNTNSAYASTSATLTATEWEFVSFSGSTADGFTFTADGADNGNAALGTYAGITTGYNIGRRTNGTNYFNGKMGEYRMSDIVRPDAWKKAEYENYINNASFLVASASEANGGASISSISFF